uniref:Signal recognition particle 9 kDa protein n=1 Tax=Paramormyrops kingsleyae TaxID=1676925 RepID=A0A3B3T184_9TELE
CRAPSVLKWRNAGTQCNPDQKIDPEIGEIYRTPASPLHSGEQRKLCVETHHSGEQRNFVSVRVVLKYRHCDGNLCMKVTDDAVCLQYKTDQAQDVKKIEKLQGKLMRVMVSKETRSMAMETD